MTAESVKASKQQQFADQSEVLANVVASMGGVQWPKLTAEQRRRRLQQARRMLREHHATARDVAIYRAAQTVYTLASELRVPMSMASAHHWALASINAYQMSLEGLADEREDKDG